MTATRTLTGYIVRATDAAVAFVADRDSKVSGIKPLWVPVKKIVEQVEMDSRSATIVTAQDGERVGTPVAIKVDSAWLDKVGVAA